MIARKLKIENKPVESYFTNGTNRKRVFQQFVLALKDLDIGQSFLWELKANDRTAIAIASTLMGRKFITRREGSKHRIGRQA